MKKISLTIITLFTAIILFAGSYAGDFMVIGTGVRAAGMGGAFAAIADDASTIYWNPAGLSQIRKIEVGLMRAFLYQNLAAYDNFNYCQPLPNNVTIGVNWTRLTIDDIPVFLEDHLVYNVDYRSSFQEYNLPGIPDGQIKSTDDVLQFAFSKHIHYNINLGWLFFDLPFDVNFGANIKYIKRDIDGNVGSGTGFDFGLLARTSLAVLFERDWLGDAKFGVNFQDVGGTTVTWEVENDNSDRTDEILFNSKMGFAIEQPLDFINSTALLSYDIDYIYEKTHHFGLEYRYKDRFALRSGLYDKNISAGISIKLYDFIVDYAFITNVLAHTNRVGLRIRL